MTHFPTQSDDWRPSEVGDLGPERPAGRVWDGGRAMLFFVLSAFASLVFGVLMFGWLGFYGSIVVAEVFAFGVIPALVCVVFRTGWRQWLGPSSMSAGAWAWAIVAVGAFGIAQSNLPVLFDRIYPIPPDQMLMYKDYLTAQSPWELARLFLIAAVVPGIFEEFSFRGVIQSGLRVTYGARHAMVWTGFLFALLHLNPWNFLGLWSFGVLLGYLVERTGSIRPAILLHVLNNSFALVVFSLQGTDQWEQRPEFIPWYWTVLAGVVLIVAIRQLHRQTTPKSQTLPSASDADLAAVDPQPG